MQSAFLETLEAARGIFSRCTLKVSLKSLLPIECKFTDVIINRVSQLGNEKETQYNPPATLT